MIIKVGKAGWREVIDGVLRREAPDGDGVYREWYASGQLQKESPGVGGATHGIVREWHENGNLKKEVPFTQGQINGTVRRWSSQGTLLGEFELRMGRGIEREWNDDGTLAMEIETFLVGCVACKVFDDLGKPHSVFLWNGKPTSRRKFFQRLEAEELPGPQGQY